jgi:hypothetical protein
LSKSQFFLNDKNDEMKSIIMFLLVSICCKSYTQQGDTLSSQYHFTRKKPNFRSYDAINTLMVLEVLEVEPTYGYDTCQDFKFNMGNHFGYCGEFTLGIKNLLAPPDVQWDYTRIKFDNTYSGPRRYVYYHGRGLSMLSNSTANIFAPSIDDGQPLYNGIKMVLDMMMYKFNFETKLQEDSVDVFVLRVIDNEKLKKYLSPEAKALKIVGGGTYIDIKSGNYVANNIKLYSLTGLVNNEFKIIVYDETNPKKYDGYKYIIEKKYFDDISKFDLLNDYLKENMGVFFFKEKRLEKIWHVRFK